MGVKLLVLLLVICCFWVYVTSWSTVSTVITERGEKTVNMMPTSK